MTEKIQARFIIQIAGKPIENVEKALNIVLDKLKAEKKKFKIIESHIEKPELDKKTTLYSGFLEISAKFADTSKILDFILDYTPASIEIEEPQKITLDTNTFTGILNDFSNNILKSTNTIRNLNAHVHILNKKIKELEGK